MALSDIQSAFSAGEISPELYGEVSLRKYSSAATTLRNMLVNYRGGALSRGGLAFVGRCKQTTNPFGGVAAAGSIFFPANPSPGDTVTLNGVVWTFIAGPTSGTNINIAGTCGGTIFFNLIPALSASVDPAITVASYNGSGGPATATLTITYNIQGTVGNGYTLAASAATPSGAALAGGVDPVLSGPPRPIPFQFSITQGYILEFGEQYLRFVYQGGYVLESPVTITAASQANPCQIGVSGTPFSNDDWVFIQNVRGMTQLNGNTYIVAGVASGHFTLKDLNGNTVDSTGFTAYTGGGTVARLYTVSTPYHAIDLPYLKYAQSADVMTLTCSNPITGVEYPPQSLTRHAAANWTLAASNFDAAIAPPASVSASSNNAAPSGTVAASFAYVVTAVDASGNESVASAVATCNGADFQITQGSNTVSWALVAGAQYYNVYRAPPSVNNGATPVPVPDGSIFGFVGSAYGTSFTDTQAVSDVAQVPPIHGNPFAPGQILAVNITAQGSGITGIGYSITTSTGSEFAGTPLVDGGQLGGFTIQDHGKLYKTGDTITFSGGGSLPSATLTFGPGPGNTITNGTYPGVSAYFQQRLFFANSFNNPDTVWATQTGLFSNFDTAIPTVATDAITTSPWSEQVNGIQWLIPMPGGLIAFTGARAWQLLGEGSYALNVQPMTPSTVQAQPQAFNGCSPTVPPVVINYDVLYVQAVGQSTVYDMTWNFFSNIYTGDDLTVLSSHLFFGRKIVQWAWAREPYKALWACADDGTLLALTYLKEQQVWGWSRHDTQPGLVVGIASVSEPPVNAVYCVVQRPNPNFTFGIYTMERIDNRLWQSVEDAYAVDSAVSNPMSFPASPVTASTTTGAVEFTTSVGVFSVATVGQVLRMSGGIATISTFIDAMHVTGTWVLGASAGSLKVPYAAVGQWSLAAPVTTLNAPHLVGMGTLVGLADGVPISGLTATGTGTITLPFAASNVKVGLPFTAQLQTPYLNGQNAVQGARKVINAATIRVEASGSFQYGVNQPDGAAQSPPQLAPAWTSMAAANLANITGGQTPPLTYNNPAGQKVTQLFTGDIRVVGGGPGWINKGQVAVQQTLPLPLDVLAVMPEMLPGDVPEVAEKPQGPRTAPSREQLKAA